MFCKITSATVFGIQGIICQVEIDSSNGLPFFNMVGLLSSESKEAKERVRIAIKNSGFGFDSKKITVNISPADIRKNGTAFDLPICIGLLYTMGKLTRFIGEDIFIVGEISLNGDVGPVQGMLPMAEAARDHGCNVLIVPKDNVREASGVDGVTVIGVGSLVEAVELLNRRNLRPTPVEPSPPEPAHYPDFSEIRGQPAAIRSALLSAAGEHNLLLHGPNGIGKTMIANALPGILPPPDADEITEITKIHSVAGRLNGDSRISRRPFRMPHQSITVAGLIGGGTYPMPGEISLAHLGVLFLDEMVHFSATTLNALRIPLEQGEVVLTRKTGTWRYPARPLLIGSVNSCPCGAFPDLARCRCTEHEILTYRRKIANPILDRFDLACAMKRPTVPDALPGPSSRELGQKVRSARTIRASRKKQKGPNSTLTSADFRQVIRLDEALRKETMHQAEQLKLSMRGFVRILRIARTVADLEQSEDIGKCHIEEALFAERNRGW